MLFDEPTSSRFFSCCLPYIKVLLMLFALGLLRLYRWVISPLLISRCRYLPTCSEYATEAIGRYGIVKGVYLTTRRLLRCHPFGGCGCDPVP